MTETPEHILEKHGMRKTNGRRSVLKIFLEHPRIALTENFLEAETNHEYDRATIYRTLNAFLDKGVLHRIYDENNAVKFALCSSDCHDGGHNHDHIHFKCVDCGTTSCLDDLQLNGVELPSGYKKMEANYLIVGTCNQCNA